MPSSGDRAACIELLSHPVSHIAFTVFTQYGKAPAR